MLILPERDWFLIAEVAERWKTTEEYVDHCLKTYKLKASFDVKFMTLLKGRAEYDIEGENFEGFGYEPIHGIYCIEGYKFLKWKKSDDGIMLADLRNPNVFLYTDESTGFNQCNDDAKSEYRFRFKESNIIKKNDIVITLQEVNRFESENSRTINTESAKTKETEPYLDPKHKHYAEELAAAVKTWLAMYDDGGKYKVKEGHKPQIKKLLENYGFSSTAIDRIATIVNPNKAGGAPLSE